MKVKCGTNRLVILTRKYAYKLPLSTRGIAANYMEYVHACGNPLIARTEIRFYGLRQECLVDTVVYRYGADENEIAEEHRHLYQIMLHNRLQVGKDKDGTWKIFDYEDVKYYLE